MRNALIIDDERFSREVLRYALTHKFKATFNIVATAESAAAGRKALMKHRCDIVFLDIEMPRETGLDFLLSLKERNFFLVIVTAYDLSALPTLEADSIGYLQKPVDPEELDSVVEQARSFGYRRRIAV